MADKDFMFIRPYCIQVLESPTRYSVNSLNAAICEIEERNLQQLLEYVVLPVSQMLSTVEREQELAVDAILCIKNVLSRTHVASWPFFSDIAFQTIRLISNIDKNSDTPVAVSSDELKQSVVSCLTELVDKASHEVLDQMYSEQFLPRLGHIVYLLLHLSAHETCRETRLLSMGCLRMLGKGLSMNKLRNKTKNCLATLIPGISVILTKIGTEGGLSGQAIIVNALQTWNALVLEVFNDEQFNSEELSSETDTVEKTDENSSFKIHQRTREWVKTSSEKIALLTEKMCVLDGHSSWNVRLALAELAGHLLGKCKRSLADSVPTCLGILIALSADDYPSVKETSRTFLQHFGSKLTPNERTLIETLQENVLELILRLPSIFRHSGDAKKLSTLDQLCGYLTILGPSLNVILSSTSHLEKLSFSLLQLCEIDCRNFPLICEKAIRSSNSIDDFTINLPPRVRKQFLYFGDERIHLRIAQLCQTLGSFGNLQLLVDHFMERFHESAVYRKQATLLLNEIISGVNSTPENSDDVYSIISFVVDQYTDASIWDLRVSNDNEDTTDSEIANSEVTKRLELVRFVDEPTSILGSNAIQLCFLLEGVANCARVLGPRFNPLLMRVLYNVLEKLGSTNVLVSHSAHLALLQIVASCSYSSIPDLILQNADYLLNCFSIKLRYNPSDFKAPTVLRVTIQQCDRRLLDLSKDIIDELLKNLDSHHGNNFCCYLKVLHALVGSVLKWFPPKVMAYSKIYNSALAESDASQINVYDFIAQYHKMKSATNESFEQFEDLEPMNPSCDGDDERSAGDDVKPKHPSYVEIVVKVLERCSHLLPSKSQEQALLVLDITDISVQALQDFEDALLPMVHKIWAPLALRFNNDNLLVTRMAFRTLCTLASICGDFVRHRVLKEVWPKILLFLEKHRPLSLNREGTSYKYTIGYKFLLDVLSNVGELAVLLRISDVDLDNLASASVLYLSGRHPVDVQMAAVKLFERLIDMNSDLVWLKLIDIYCDDQHLPMHPAVSEFRPIRVFGRHKTNVEFKKNVLLLFEFMDRSTKRFGPELC